MGTEILRPQDCLIQRLRVTPNVFPRRKCFYGNTRTNRKPAVRTERSDRPKRFTNPSPEALISKRPSSDDLKSSATRSNSSPVMGQVKILRRGESFDTKINCDVINNDLDLIQRLGPDVPEMVPKQIRINDTKSFLSPVSVRSDVYAGSSCSMSPSPRSLPLPSFYKKKQVISPVDDSATRDLRRLLRLD